MDTRIDKRSAGKVAVAVAARVEAAPCGCEAIWNAAARLDWSGYLPEADTELALVEAGECDCPDGSDPSDDAVLRRIWNAAATLDWSAVG